MGLYNPRAPQVLGPEWVAIRDENVVFSPAVSVVEHGHTFYNTASRTAADGRFYLKDLPIGPESRQVYMVNVYPAGTEDQTGPIRRCVIPVNSVSVTGTFDTAPTTLILAGTAADYNLGGLARATVNVNTSQKRADTYFAVNQYTQELVGKRILEVNLLLAISWNPVSDNTFETADRFGELVLNSFINVQTGGTGSNQISLLPDSFFQLDGATLLGIPGMLLRPDVVGEGESGSTRVTRLRLGEINPFWQTPSTTLSQVAMPWRIEELQRFEASAGTNRTWIRWEFGSSVRWLGEYTWNYAALEVVYCEEKRIGYGGIDTDIRNPGGQHAWDKSVVPVTLATPSSLTTSPVLAIGEYLVTVHAADSGDQPGVFEFPSSKSSASNPAPTLNGLREYIGVPSHHGVQVNVTKTEGEVFTSEDSVVLPQLSLHEAAGTPFADVHGYGRLARAQVYSNATATQDILASAILAPITGSYPQVRFYARRFGDTVTPLRLLHTATPTTFVEITPNDFDELDAILDGWKEVTLRLNTAITLHSASGTQNFTWQAPLESSGNRWEILGLTAPSVSGTPGNPFNLAPTAARLGGTTYGGTTADADWMPQYAPPVSGTAADTTTDLILILSQDPATITGLAVTGLSQELTAYTECETTPCCTPTHLGYHRLTWSLPNGAGVVGDDFTRSGTGWNTATSGQTYTDSGGTVPGNYVTTGERGTHVLDSANVTRHSTIAGSITDSHQRIRSSLNVQPAGASIRRRLIGHFADVNNYDYVDFRSSVVNQQMELVIANIVGGAVTSLTNIAVGAVFADQDWFLDVDFNGGTIRAKAWPAEEDEPESYQASAAAAFTSGGVGVGSIRSTGNTDGGAIASYDDYEVGPSTWSFGHYELQRTDTVENEWKTIMKATNPATSSFNDYEARVGIESSYRIRSVNALRFEGAWSSEVDATLTEPGVTLPACGAAKRGVLIFTTNEVQDGSSNLAYAMTWEGTVDEQFFLVEADSVQLQLMFDRDYQVAFHGTERGGEAFTRTLLLANAAVAEPRLANAHSLRDLAWQDLPYVCVRDDIGDRWLSTVIVPELSARRNRRIYNAVISVVEVTATPSPVNP